jgi:hypothetical protein
MRPLYDDPCFTFRFADDRIIPRFHLEKVEVGRRISVFRIDPDTGKRLSLLTTATVGEGGWVDLPVPLNVQAGDSFIVVPDVGSVAYSPLRILLTTVGVPALLATVGYLVGLAQGRGNAFLLAVCYGGLGAFVILLGYGPIALLIGMLGIVAERLHQKKKGSLRKRI